MNYLKTIQEVIDYCPRVDVPSGKELAFSNVSSRLVDDFCGRSISIKYYLTDFELSASMVGFVPKRPIISLPVVSLPTGLRVRPLTRTYEGGRKQVNVWWDIPIPVPLDDILNVNTGRLELIGGRFFTDYGRSQGDSTTSQLTGASRQRLDVYAWFAELEVYAGFLVDTTFTAPVSHGSQLATLASTVGIEVGTILQFNNVLTDYTVTSIDSTTNIVGFTPSLAGTLGSGISVTEKVPEDIKIAVGQIIEDRITFQPNVLRSTETLDVLTDRLSRMSVDPVPLDAQRLLAKYRN